jgi:hypothetical protein
MANTTIKCEHANCNSQGWDSYTIGGEIYIECVTCERRIEGNFQVALDGWIERIAKVGA